MMNAARTFAPSRLILRRTFFASFCATFTDHTALLRDAEIHCLPLDDGKKQYVLAASDMEADMVKKVPQLHLSRLYLDDSKIYGAKVVNRTLGNVSHCCGRLLDAALKDGGKEAHATLHGLSEWVLKEKLTGLEESEAKILEEIANGNLENYDDKLWEQLAMDYVNLGEAEEANLYTGKNATLIRIEHQADITEFANTSGGAMAIFRFA